MKVWQQQPDGWTPVSSLHAVLPVDFAEKPVIAAVGGGGKTAVLHRLAIELMANGKKVVLTTTTHLLMPEDEGSLTDDLAVIRHRLEKDHFALVGRPAGNGKMMGVPKRLYQELCTLADVVLVEADGSKHLPLKLPASHEPVIPDNSTHVLVLAGLSALGQMVCKACHRPELVMNLLKVGDEHRLTADDIAAILQQGYWIPFVQSHDGRGQDKPGLRRTGAVILNQADNQPRRDGAARIAKLLAPIPCLITQLEGDDR
jgi:probable selenium-dependent hydroxylase accessory protein YqeC